MDLLRGHPYFGGESKVMFQMQYALRYALVGDVVYVTPWKGTISEYSTASECGIFAKEPLKAPLAHLAYLCSPFVFII